MRDDKLIEMWNDMTFLIGLPSGVWHGALWVLSRGTH